MESDPQRRLHNRPSRFPPGRVFAESDTPHNFSVAPGTADSVQGSPKGNAVILRAVLEEKLLNAEGLVDQTERELANLHAEIEAKKGTLTYHRGAIDTLKALLSATATPAAGPPEQFTPALGPQKKKLSAAKLRQLEAAREKARNKKLLGRGPVPAPHDA